MTVPSLTDLRMTHDPAARGYHAVYRAGATNHCPGCGRTQWVVGRLTAECAFCSTALPLDEAGSTESAKPVIMRRGLGGGRVQ